MNEDIKRVAYDEDTKKYIQLLAAKNKDNPYYTLVIFPDTLCPLESTLIECRTPDEVLDWMHEHYKIVAGLPALVYKSCLDDCTIGGISADRGHLYIISDMEGLDEPEDIRDCVCVNWYGVDGQLYVRCLPLCHSERSYCDGGNFLYSSDKRFSYITYSHQPIAIHDRWDSK